MPTGALAVSLPSGAVNRIHNWYCNRESWKRHVREEVVPPAIDGLHLGNDVLEVGPGFGPGTEVLSERAERLTALEIDPDLAAALRSACGRASGDHAVPQRGRDLIRNAG